MTTDHSKRGGTNRPVLYVYRCIACDYRGETHRHDDSHDGDRAVCEHCGAIVVLEWDGGVQLCAETTSTSRKRH
ncbi:MAG TPA: hypothetical protein DD808_17695 [Halieaceae bacterium]|nr:hypothetical protein [Haliea sp.]HBQ42377.1 hypothetical protein [Halieaceae bacterium]MAY92337.1 hypothetical protein [Haliea sp.]MBK40229.1 hypothetical protein [Haliea sp.]MBP70759.1 hypothetical protein [Haliea sp.]